MAINSTSSYGFTKNENLASQGTVCKKIVFHNFSNIYKEMFAEYYYKQGDEQFDNINQFGIGIKADINDNDEAPAFFPFQNFFVGNDVNFYAKGLYTYPERNLRYTNNKERNNDWYETFKETSGQSMNKEGFGTVIPLKLETKIHDIEKKYPNNLNTIKISTAVKESHKLQRDLAPCDNSNDNDCLYIVLNSENYEIICGGFKQRIINNTNKAIVIPSDSIQYMGVKCDRTQCLNCQNCNNGNCCVYKIDLKSCHVYIYNNIYWVNDDNNLDVSEWHDYLSGQNVETDFYFIKKISININESENAGNDSYYIECEKENVYNSHTQSEETKKNPYGSLWFNNKGNKICRNYFAFPNITHTTLNSVPYLPIMFMDVPEKTKNVCSKFEITYNYYLPKEIFVSITKNSIIKTYISFDKSFKDDELLLGSMEIPQNDYIPSFDSTLNINEECQRGLTDIRHDKLINDNHQRIRFDEICNQTNRELISGITNIKLTASINP